MRTERDYRREALSAVPAFLDGNEAVYTVVQALLGPRARGAAPRGVATREIRDATFRVVEPRYPFAADIGRDPLRSIAGAETLQLIGGFSDATAMVHVAPQFEKFTDEGELKGAYGPRTGPHMHRVIKLLERDPDTRQAVVNVYSAEDDLRDTPFKDVPCTVSFTFRMDHGSLQMKTHMRSNDAWLGLPYDLCQFMQLQCTVANVLGAPVGAYTHHVDSLHLYERDVERARVLTPTTSAGPHLDGLYGVTWEDVKRRAHEVFYGHGGELTETERFLSEALRRKLTRDSNDS